ncbi:hypothetical protein pdul_cds_845 [Pandoravirus dulcis]|uniref:BTB domain containing protein n=1 Tax=Pandoravirus dulcis TaxID=1349409 RepID=S4VYW9_9VIRU|nr:hypothetical protein pdul_cds_845 [Pandoravirus dulcis]AGO83059.1 hypothetical protein pdul_cds_845 [Pandoravirus dulcis]
MDVPNPASAPTGDDVALCRPAKRARHDEPDESNTDHAERTHEVDHATTIDITFVAPESLTVTVTNVDVAGLCARSAYFAAMLTGGFAESDAGTHGGSVTVRLPAGRIDAAALERLAGILDGTARPTAADALGLSGYLAFFEAAPCLRECKEALAAALGWSSSSTSSRAAPDPYAILALYALTVAEDDVSASWADLHAGLFSVDSVWSAPPKEAEADDGHADEGGDRCDTHMRVDLAAYVACGAALLEAAHRVVESDIGASPCAGVLLDVVQCTPGLLAAATADAMSDWFAPLAPMRALLNAPFALSACRVLSPMGTLFETTRTDPAGAAVPCFAPSHEAFVAALAADSPCLVDAILSTGVLGPGAVLAGGAVVNAMQSPTLRHRLDDSDVDMWIVGGDEHHRRRTFARVIGALFDALPGARVTVRGSVVTFVIDDGDDNNTDRDSTAPSGSDGHEQDGGRRAAETLQVIYTDVQTAHDVIDDFDMTHACAYYDGTDVCASWACVWTVVSRMTVALPGITPNPRRIARAAAKGFAFAPPASGTEVAAHPADTGTETSDRNNNNDNERDDSIASVPLDHETAGSVAAKDGNRADGDGDGNGKSDVAMGRDINLPGNDYGSLWGMMSDPEPVAYDGAAALLGHFTHASMVSNSSDVFPKLEVTLQTEVTPLAAIARVRVPPMCVTEPMVCMRCRAPDTAPNTWCLDSRRCAGRGDRLVDDNTRVVTVAVADDKHAARAHACGSRLRTMDAEIEALHETLSRDSPTADQWGDSVPWVPMVATVGPIAVGNDDNNAKPERWRMHLRYTKHTTIRDALTGEILAPRRVGTGSYIAARLAVYGIAHNDVCTTPARHCRLFAVYPPHLWHVVRAVERALASV